RGRRADPRHAVQPRRADGLLRQHHAVPHPRSVGRAGQPDPPLSQLGDAGRCLRPARARPVRRDPSRRAQPHRRRQRKTGADAVSDLAYLDWNATAPLLPEARAAMTEALAHAGNPSSVHRAGRDAKKLLEAARARIAQRVGAPPDHVVFTGGGTEANNLALRGFPDRRIIVSAIEHDSVLAAAARPALVSVMLANNETGAIQPVAEAAAIAHRHGALLHCDAVQALGKISFNYSELNADLMTISAHKIGGPMGVGALIASPALALRPAQTGGGQERGRRAGTENLPGIAGFAAACEVAGDMGAVAAHRDAIEQRLLSIAPDARIHALGAPRLPNTTNISITCVISSTQVMALDLAGVMVSAGSACSSGKVRRSHVLDAMGVPPDLAE